MKNIYNEEENGDSEKRLEEESMCGRNNDKGSRMTLDSHLGEGQTGSEKAIKMEGRRWMGGR